MDIRYLLPTLALATASTGLPSSPWLALRGTPPPNGAVGVIIGREATGNSYRVFWSLGGQSTERETDLVSTPDPDRLPTLGPLKWPAVFDVNGKYALVFGKRGWGWIEGSGDVAYREKEIKETLEHLEEDVRKGSPGGFTRHGPTLVLLPQQQLRRGPGEDSPLSDRTMPTSWRSAGCRGGIGEIQSNPVLLNKEKATLVHGDIPVRVVERKGDWIKVILPKPELPVYQCCDGGLISWESVPAGWAQAAKPGPVPQTRVLLWHSTSWGWWP
jgi:hypothetical protein